MASVNRVYSALKDLVNKDQRGFVTPAVFNSFASVAQMNIYNKLFEESTVLAKRLRNAQLDAGRIKSRQKQLNEDLSVFITRTSISCANFSGIRTAEFPEDFSKAVSAVIYNGISPTIPQTQIQLLYDEEQINYVLSSNLSAPSNDFPVGLITIEGSIRSMQVFPSTITQIYLTYYKLPQGLDTEGYRVASQPRFGYTVVAGKEIYSATNSIDFELPEHYFADLVTEIAKLIGVNLRDQDVYAYSANEQKMA